MYLAIRLQFQHLRTSIEMILPKPISIKEVLSVTGYVLTNRKSRINHMTF